MAKNIVRRRLSERERPGEAGNNTVAMREGSKAESNTLHPHAATIAPTGPMVVIGGTARPYKPQCKTSC